MDLGPIEAAEACLSALLAQKHIAGIGAAGFAAMPQLRAEPHWPSGQFNRDFGLLVSVVGDDLALRKGNRPGMETQNRGVAGDPNVIKLRVRDIAQLFNTLDASPFRIRDISSAVDQYIVDWAQELPQGQPIKIDVYLESGDATERETSDIYDAFRSWYTEKENAETTAIRTLFRDGRHAFLIGMSLLAACLFFAWRLSQGYQGPFARLMQESLVIIGWVVIWRPIEIFLYDWIPLVRRRKLYRRLAASKVTAVSATRPS